MPPSTAPRRVAVVLVHYHTPELVRGACEALARDAEESGLELETVLVDNGSRPEDRALLDSMPARRLDPGRNLGYAGGANLGLRETTAAHAVVMNPDVLVLPGCLATLVEALHSGAAAAGPRFFWDAGRRFQLPPTEPVSRRWELAALLARRGGRWALQARRRWRRHARRHWQAREPLPSYDLSGALLALRRDAWQHFSFDEGYRLYFEETDWLQRLRDAGLVSRYVPSAQAIHLYAQSTAREGRAREWFLESSRRFRRRRFGAVFTALLEHLSRRQPAAGSPPRGEPQPGSSQEALGAGAWLEVSPSPSGFPAAGCELAAAEPLPASLPEDIWQRLAPGSYYLRAVSAGGQELGLRVLEKR